MHGELTSPLLPERRAGCRRRRMRRVQRMAGILLGLWVGGVSAAQGAGPVVAWLHSCPRPHGRPISRTIQSVFRITV